MTMRTPLQPVAVTPACPLLDASDLPGAEDWSVIESLHCEESFDVDDDRFATLSVASGFDD
jgi:hypothetical protein